ncbi:MAG: carbon storage regulator [Pirellulales bacterium]
MHRAYRRFQKTRQGSIVLARKNKQSVVIGAAGNMNELLRVTVVEIRGGTVKLGFLADSDVAVHREEVWERVRGENQALPRKPPAQLPRERIPHIH